MQTGRWCDARLGRRRWCGNLATRARLWRHAPSPRSARDVPAPARGCYIRPRSRFPQSQVITRLVAYDVEAPGRLSQVKTRLANLRRARRPFKVHQEFSCFPVIASAAKQSMAQRMRKDGLLRRFAPRNDGNDLDRGENSMQHFRCAGLAILITFAAGQALAQEKLKIGVIVTLSGPAAALG